VVETTKSEGEAAEVDHVEKCETNCKGQTFVSAAVSKLLLFL
jgi:hypothetical protein